MNQPIYKWERAIANRPDIFFEEFKLEHHAVIFAFGYAIGGKRGRKIPIKWDCEGRCYLRYTSNRFPDGDLNVGDYD